MKLLGKKDIGNFGERIAARYLRRNGYKLLAKNVQCGRNELDLVVKNKECIAFVEVKTLTFDTPESVDRRPARAVDLAKRRRTVEAACMYLREHPIRLCPRFDVVEVYLDRSNRLKPFQILHIPAAFDAKGTVH
ncbi:MAG: YraN family protein [Clostridia bacterium]|nr:YraN family protein [Clostridia bacterium]